MLDLSNRDGRRPAIADALSRLTLKKPPPADLPQPLMVLVRPIKIVGVSRNTADIGIGFTESMIATLSKYNGLKIFSSNTSFHVAEENLNGGNILQFLRDNQVF